MRADLVDTGPDFRVLFDASPVGMALLGLDGGWVRINPAVSAMLGYPPAELLGLHPRAVTHPDDRDADADAVRDLLAGRETSYQLHKRFVRKDGGVITCLLTVTLLRDEGGSPQHFLAQVADVTLDRRNQELLDVVVEATPDLLLLTTPEGRVVRANPSWQRILGWSENDLFGLDVTTLIHPADRPAGGRGLTGMRAQDLRLRCRHRDGTYRWLEWNAAPLPGQGLIVATGRDVSATVATEEALRLSDVHTRTAAARDAERLRETTAALDRLAQSERRFAEVFEHSPIAKLVVGLRGAERGRITLANPALGRLFGGTVANAAGRPVTDVLPEDRAELESNLAALASGRMRRTVREMTVHRADGTPVLVAAHILAIHDEHGPSSAVVQLLDVTAERAAARAARREVLRLRATLAVQRDVTAAASDRDATMRVVAERAIELFDGADGAAVELLEGDRLRYVATAGVLAPFQNQTIGVDGSLSGRALATDSPAHCTDTARDGRVDRESCRRLGIGSMLVAPLHAGNRVIGVVKVSARGPANFDDMDEQQLALLAASLGSALRHADDAARNAALLAERTVALEALEASETRFRMAFQNSPLGVTLISLQGDMLGTFLDANPAMSAITGRSAEELPGLSYRDVVHPGDVPDMTALLMQALAGELDQVRVERRYVHADGHVVWVSECTATVRDQNGRARYLVSQIEDVTARRAAEATLRQQARLLELIPAAVIVRDLDGTVRWWNAGATELYGWPLSAAAGRVTHRLLSTAYPAGQSADDQLAALLADGHWSGALQHQSAHGRPVSVVSRQVVDHGDGEPRVLEINADVTAFRAAERALAESEQRFRAQFAYSAAGQLIQGLDGRLTAANRALADMLGSTVDELTGADYRHRLHPDDVPAAARQLAGLFAGEADAFTHEGRLRHGDGHWVDVSATISIVRDADDRPRHLIGVVTDISARRAAERARDRAAADLADRNTALEAANQLKLDIIGMLGHEIGNPLSSIKGYTEVLIEDWADLDDRRRERAVEAIARQSGRLDEIVREVLAMVTIDAGTITSVRQRLDAREEVRRALVATENEQVPMPGDDAELLCNPGHLQQILTNLLSNAAKYGGGATGVTIARHGDRVRISVADGGPGVPEEFRHRLFQRLARAERDATSVRGTGLGLYIVRGLARANHGDIHHEPGPTGGSVFVLDLAAA